MGTAVAFEKPIENTPAPNTDLVVRLREHDPEAMSELYDKFATRLYSVIVRVVRDQAIAEDILQETFLRVWNHAGDLHGPEGLWYWLLTIARNRAIDHTRSHSARMQKLEVVTELNGNLMFPFQAAGADPVKVRTVREIMDKLETRHKTVIALAYFRGLSQTEIAALMHQPLGTVKAWTRSALKQLREALATA
jgi:RNA polymerase sigma-70 factor (ECF subfamily)